MQNVILNCGPHLLKAAEMACRNDIINPISVWKWLALCSLWETRARGVTSEPPFRSDTQKPYNCVNQPIQWLTLLAKSKGSSLVSSPGHEVIFLLLSSPMRSITAVKTLCIDWLPRRPCGRCYIESLRLTLGCFIWVCRLWNLSSCSQAWPPLLHSHKETNKF